VAVLTILVGLAAAILARCFGTRGAPVLGLVGQASALLLAAAISMAVFGLAPAGIIGRTAGFSIPPRGVGGWDVNLLGIPTQG
jgi:hypothetical protein